MRRDRAQRFYQIQAPIYDVTRRAFLFRRRRALELLELKPGHTVADFGCGTGLNLPELFGRGARQVFGIDASEAMLNRAKAKSPDAILIQADLETFRLKPAVDRILCTYALSMVENWEAALEHMAASLTPEGVLVILDFSPLRSMFKPLEPAFKTWLRGFGVHHRRDVGASLRKHFSCVHEESLSVGYCAIYVGRELRSFKTQRPES